MIKASNRMTFYLMCSLFRKKKMTNSKNEGSSEKELDLVGRKGEYTININQYFIWLEHNDMKLDCACVPLG